MSIQIPKILKAPSLEAIVMDTPEDGETYFNKTYGEKDSPDAIIKFEVIHGSSGMAPMIDRGSPSPVYKGGGASEVQVRGGVISEKIYITEEESNECLSNDPHKKRIAEELILEKVEGLIRRNGMRKEWMGSQVYFNNGVVSYHDKRGTRFTVDFKIPTENMITLATNFKWATGTTRNPLKDVSYMQSTVKRSGGTVTKVFATTNTINEKIRDDANIRDLIKTSAFPMKNNLYTQTPECLSEFLGVQLQPYDETFRLDLTIMRIVDTTNIIVDDATGLRVGTKCWLVRVDENEEEKVEAATIASVNTTTNNVEFTAAVSTSSYIANQDMLQCEVPFCPENRLVFVAEKVKGDPIMKWYNAPIGFGANRYGVQVESWDRREPDVIITRAQRNGIWALKYPKAIASLDI